MLRTTLLLFGCSIDLSASLCGCVHDSELPPGVGVVIVEVDRGGASHEFSIPVVDLHRTVPSQYLEVSGAIVHPLSLQAARNYTLPYGGLYIAQVRLHSIGG